MMMMAVTFRWGTEAAMKEAGKVVVVVVVVDWTVHSSGSSAPHIREPRS